ncbi:MAG: LysR family transcriptional regulator [Myxococcota bacterium]
MADSELDWRWVESFVQVAEAGGATAAEQRTGKSQATFSRHVKQLEEHLGVALFDRAARGLSLTPRGQHLLARAGVMRDAAKAFELDARALDAKREGPVRVTMTQAFGHFFAPRWLPELRDAYPGITVDLVLADDAVNLLHREAEIAVRMFKPTQLDLVTRRCGELRLGFFASPSYLDQRGTPMELEALFEHELVGFDRIGAWVETARNLGYRFDRHHFRVRTDAIYLHAPLIAAGLGIGVLPVYLEESPDLVRVFPAVAFPGQSIFLTAAADLRSNALISAVWDHLADALEDVFKPSADV